ncbi:MAG: NADPH-dependent F420 reductase [Candidatus Micrarchaeota archaeon]|nr:MAG: NADPH-dependent F420 reductase [Candidatus Micrarchaeota archaeon]
MKIAIIGTGNVGRALGEALIKKGYSVVYGSRDPASKASAVPKGAEVKAIKDALNDAEVAILAVPNHAIEEIINAAGKDSFNGKIVVDVSNALDKDFKPLNLQDSIAERIAKMLPNAKVVKAFNTVFAQNMSKAKVGRTKLTAFIAADDAEAKKRVMEISEKIGFEPVDAGELKAARYLEQLGLFQIHLGYFRSMGTNIGIKLVKA